ncbi:heavy-metal-associated domain-containing protein [Kribbella sp. NPDC026611]|uniref:heavy-metal-associated domain-containing protein n=1 Tax=Kribbella sp. NPDC026611 TaxID=3154911 RepID=UPI0033C2B022
MGATDRVVVARVLAELGYDAFAGPVPLGPAVKIGYEVEPVRPGEHDEFIRTRLQPCPPALVTSATHRVAWTDSTGVSNVAHAGSLGATVPIVARETTLAIWSTLDVPAALPEAKLLEDVTTDKDPRAIFRTGVDAAARVIVQHAYLAAKTPYDDPAVFAAVLRDSGLFSTVAGTWHWGLQASTYRRGLIPVQLICFGGRVAYSADTVAALRAMKEQRIEEAPHGSDPSAQQYAALQNGEHPRCLAHPPLGAQRTSLVTWVADLFVDTFIQLLDTVDVTTGHRPAGPNGHTAFTVFEVPDMTCQHCIRTITKAVAEFGVDPPEFDLETKRVTARFRDAETREQSFDAIRGRGYTVVPPAG